MASKRPDAVNAPPFETEELRKQLAAFLDAPFTTPTGEVRKVGDFKWGVYAFFDYDLEPIYVGQTNEKLRTRIRRHLTNQRTDAVAMPVLDPFEVFEIEVWPLPDLQNVDGKNAEARLQLNALERVITAKAVAESEFHAILNEKDPPPGLLTVDPPPSQRGRVVSEAVYRLRSHPDFRIARRSLIISRLAQVISERKVQGGLRRVLLTQAKRLQWLADRRFVALGGEKTVEAKTGAESSDEDE